MTDKRHHADFEVSERKPTLTSHRQALLQLNIAVALFGLSGLLGKATTASALMIVMGRTAFGALAFALLFATGLLPKPNCPVQRLRNLAWPGLLLAFHWVTFFQSIRTSSVAIALLSYSTFPIIVTWLEPILFRERRRRIDVVTALLVLFGLFVLTPKFDLHDVATAGVVWGFVSGVSFAFVILMNRYFAVDIPPATIAASQNLFATIAMLALLPIYYEPLTGRDWMILVVLGVIFTALAHYLFIHSLTKVRVQLASIISSMESIYGVAFAWLLLGERPTLRTCCGGALILAAVLLGAFAHSNSATEIAEGQSAT